MSISSVMAEKRTENYKHLKEKINEIKKEDSGLFYALNLFCERAYYFDIKGEAARAIIRFLDLMPQQEDLKVQCYQELYNRLKPLRFLSEADKEKAETALALFVRWCDDYRKKFDELPLFSQCAKEFLTEKVADSDIKEAISTFMDANYKIREDKEAVYLEALSLVIDFNIKKISKEKCLELLMPATISTPQAITEPSLDKRVSKANNTTFHSYNDLIHFFPAQQISSARGRSQSRVGEYTDSSKEQGEAKFLNTGKDWARNCNNIHLIVANENKTFLEWVYTFKLAPQSKEDFSAFMADMTDSEKATFMLNFVAVMKKHLATKLGLTELTQEQTIFIENVMALVNQHAFGYKMQTELCAMLIQGNITLAKEGKNHDVTVHIELEQKEVIIIEKGFLELEDSRRVSYIGKTRLKPNAEGVQATTFVRHIAETTEKLYKHGIEPAVVLMSPCKREEKQRKLLANPIFQSERKDILSRLDLLLKKLVEKCKPENETNLQNRRIKLQAKLDEMWKALLVTDKSAANHFSKQRNLVQDVIETTNTLQDLEIFDHFFSVLYIESQIPKIKESLSNDSISERDLLIAMRNIQQIKRYSILNKAAVLELDALGNALESFRKKHFEIGHYSRYSKMVPKAAPLAENELCLDELASESKGDEEATDLFMHRSFRG